MELRLFAAFAAVEPAADPGAHLPAPPRTPRSSRLQASRARSRRHHLARDRQSWRHDPGARRPVDPQRRGGAQGARRRLRHPAHAQLQQRPGPRRGSTQLPGAVCDSAGGKAGVPLAPVQGNAARRPRVSGARPRAAARRRRYRRLHRARRPRLHDGRQSRRFGRQPLPGRTRRARHGADGESRREGDLHFLVDRRHRAVAAALDLVHRRALAHGSQAADNYERLEFLGDRVLGLAVAEWLYETFAAEPEGALSKRLNALVTGAVCAEVARAIGVQQHLRLGKQARDDGASESDNVLGDVMEALIGAVYLDGGYAPARDFVRRAWQARVHADARAPQHPKTPLQEWAAAHSRTAPAFEVTDRSGPHHAPRFTVRVRLGTFAQAEASGASKQEAETAAAAALLAQVA